MFALKNCKQLRCEVQGQTTYICLPCILCCSFIDFDPFSGFRDLLNGCKIVVCHSSTIHNESTRSPWIGRLRRTGAIFFFPPEFTFKICFFATNYGILHYIKTCTSQNFKPCFVHSFSLFVQTTKQTLNSWNAQEILPGPHFFPVILLTPARHPVQVHWRQQGLYHPIRLSRRGHIYAWPEPWTKAGWRMHRATWGGRRSERMHTATRGPGRRKTTMPSAPPSASIQEVS